MLYNPEYCFSNYQCVLYSGFQQILESPFIDAFGTLPIYQGNYLINNNDLFYAGEAENISARIKQQFSIKTSTFFRNYLKDYINGTLAISDFKLRILQTKFGRNELEEFCITNLPAKLNKSQLEKQTRYICEPDPDCWEWVQSNQNECLKYLEDMFDKHLFQPWEKAVIYPGGGVYQVIHSTDGIIYIGESSDIKERFKQHSGETRKSAFRRSIATQLFGFKLKTKGELGKITNEKKRMYVFESEDREINQYLSDCIIKSMNISLGRFEFEKHLIKKLKPRLNIKDNTGDDAI